MEAAMIRTGLLVAVAMVAALPVVAAERRDDTDAAKTSKQVELELSRWRHRPASKADLTTADELVRSRPADDAANRLDATSFDLLMIRREWADPAARDLPR
jgi:hypothetical protein